VIENGGAMVMMSTPLGPSSFYPYAWKRKAVNGYRNPDAWRADFHVGIDLALGC